MSRMKLAQLGGGLATASLLVALTGAPASAASPDISRTPGGTQTILHEECGFPVLEETKTGQNLVQTFYDSNGDVRTIHVAGSFHGTLTNVESGESIALNFSGAGNIDVETGDLSGHGPFLIGSPDDPATAEFDGFIVLVQGNTSASLNFETSVVTIHSTTGPVTDICAALA
jgi:hypothetical protein